jgi:hypothetical protein
MKYQVGVVYTFEGEFSIEADSEEEAREIVKEITFSDPFSDGDLSGDGDLEITEVYEWDEAAQQKHSELIAENFKNFDKNKQEGNK